MLQCVATDKRSIADYTATVGEERIVELHRLAKPLRGARVLHLNATAAGGGVAEILKTMVPLMSDLGLSAEWRVLRGADEFYKVTKTIHNGLQGMPVRLKPEMKETWLRYNRLNTEIRSANGRYDFVIVHDPQPAGILRLLRQSNGHHRDGVWLWRCHLDFSFPRLDVWRFLKPYVDIYDAAIFSKREYFPPDFTPRCFEVSPGIDPLSLKNRLLDEREVYRILKRYGVDPERPFIFKVSRFDPWKDFLGVIDIYHLLRKEFPSLELVPAHSSPRPGQG